MRPFLCQRFACSRIVSVVFCALVLLNLRALDGAVPDGEYGSFSDHYGNNLEGLTPGEVFVKQGTGAMILVYDRSHYFQMHTGPITQEQREVTCHLYTYPGRADSWPRQLKKVRRVPLSHFHLTLALINRFLGRFLPFHWNYCNKFNYMNYILYGQLTVNRDFRECPLAAPFLGLRLGDVRGGSFKLRDSNGREHDFVEYNNSRQGRTIESLKQVSRSASSRQGETSPAWVQHTSSFRRMVLNVFGGGTFKRRRSVSLEDNDDHDVAPMA